MRNLSSSFSNQQGSLVNIKQKLNIQKPYQMIIAPKCTTPLNQLNREILNLLKFSHQNEITVINIKMSENR